MVRGKKAETCEKHKILSDCVGNLLSLFTEQEMDSWVDGELNILDSLIEKQEQGEKKKKKNKRNKTK